VETADPERTLFICFPDTGEVAGRYRAWRDPRIAVHVVELPGRGERRDEHPYRDMWLLVESLTGELASVLARPHVLFGAGLGALVAYRLAQRRVAGGSASPGALVVAHQAPPVRAARVVPEQARAVRVVPDQAERVGWVVREDADQAARTVPEQAEQAARAVPEQLERADVSLLASDAHLPVAPPLPCPIRGFGEPHVMAGWGEHTTAGFVLTPARAQDSAALLRDAVLRAAYLISALAAQEPSPPSKPTTA
jgi:surfactin synthase thioesterase subunit